MNDMEDILDEASLKEQVFSLKRKHLFKQLLFERGIRFYYSQLL